MPETVVESRILNPTVIGISSAVIHTTPANHRVVMKQLIICNTNGVDAWFSLAIDGAASAPANCVFFRMTVGAYDTLILDTQIVLEVTDTIEAMADRTGVNITIVGWDHTLT